MPTERTRARLLAFLHDVARGGALEQHLAADVTFTALGTAQQLAGRAAVARLLRTYYGGAFDARPHVTLVRVRDELALLAFDFIATHTGEFLGVAATGRRVRVPGHLALDVRDDLIVALVGHLPIDRLLRQLHSVDEAD